MKFTASAAALQPAHSSCPSESWRCKACSCRRPGRGDLPFGTARTPVFVELARGWTGGHAAAKLAERLGEQHEEHAA